eukprot:3811508-Alexandrium_andersonii.AAC.1
MCIRDRFPPPESFRVRGISAESDGGGAPPLPKGESPPGLAERELAELRVKALLVLGQSAPALAPA